MPLTSVSRYIIMLVISTSVVVAARAQEVYTIVTSSDLLTWTELTTTTNASAQFLSRIRTLMSFQVNSTGHARALNANHIHDT
jgi:hypothetical protein